jgi:hypothetical protein
MTPTSKEKVSGVTTENKSADEIAIHKARQKHIDEWCKGKTAFYNHETLVVGQNFEAGMREGLAHEREKSKRLIEVMQLALKLSRQHPEFRLCAMEPFEKAIASYTAGGAE